jgi:hypothetical protein
MYKTHITLPEKIRSKSVAALLAGLVALTALSMTPLSAMTSLSASAGTAHGTSVTDREIRHVVDKYLAEHPELLSQAAPAPQGICVGDSEHQC